jgi:hypothetical protein
LADSVYSGLWTDSWEWVGGGGEVVMGWWWDDGKWVWWELERAMGGVSSLFVVVLLCDGSTFYLLSSVSYHWFVLGIFWMVSQQRVFNEMVSNMIY